MQDFKGKTAVVTGAASGIGLALAERFATAGMQVVMADIQEDALDEAVKKLRDRQAQVIGVVTDAMLEESVRSLAERAIGEYGRVHVLCNNAGVTNTISAGLPVWEIPKVDWDWVMGVNFQGVLYGLQAFVPHMLEHGEAGHIVNTASGAALLPGQGPYGVSKHAVLCLTETLHADLQAHNSAVGASVLCPGFVNTNIIEAERNRPAGLATGADPIDPELIAMGHAVLALGKQPDAVAEEVFESIQRDSVYILPNHAWDEVFAARVESILARGGPLLVDQAEIIERTGQGEDF
jgi:NAD(P)-dependent dehydrogenase (short-subunit alcohol dehydrogenase family)